MRAASLNVLIRRYRAEVETLKRRIRRGLATERDKERLALAHRRLVELQKRRRAWKGWDLY